MINIPALTRRELGSFFHSPMAYIVGVLFLVISGAFFYVTAAFSQQASLRDWAQLLIFILIFVAPILSMRQFSEEKRVGTIETLMTAPVTDAQVILGKFLGAMGLYLVLLASTLAYFALIVVYGTPDYGVAVMGYLGMVLLGAVFIAVGIFSSTLTRHQLVAGLVGIAILGFFTMGVYLLVMLLPDTAEVINRLNMIRYFGDFSKGVFDTQGLVFFVSVTAFFLFLSTKVLESRRWR